MEITNSQIKVLKKLKDKKYRKEYGKFIIEGEKLCNEALIHNLDIELCLTADKDIFEKMKVFDFQTILVEEYIINCLSTAKTPQKVLMIARIKEMDKFSEDSNILVLEKLQDMGNVGTLLRSACAFGFKNVFLIDGVDVYDEKVLRSSMGAVFKLNIIKGNMEEFKKYRENSDFKVIVADMKGKNVYSVGRMSRFALVLGNEGNGLSQEIKNLADEIISIQMENNTESLNVSVAGSIIMSYLYSMKF